jgi:hypothetical protein
MTAVSAAHEVGVLVGHVEVLDHVDIDAGVVARIG